MCRWFPANVLQRQFQRSGRSCMVFNLVGSANTFHSFRNIFKPVPELPDLLQVNPDTIIAQMQSGIIFGITAVLWGEITLKDGRVQQTNFDDYRMLRINEAPIIEVEVVKSSEAPGGIGEPGTSTLTPAVLNAVYAATGVRLRKLPIKSDLLRST